MLPGLFQETPRTENDPKRSIDYFRIKRSKMPLYTPETLLDPCMFDVWPQGYSGGLQLPMQAVSKRNELKRAVREPLGPST